MPWPHSNELGKNPPPPPKTDSWGGGSQAVTPQTYADWFQAETQWQAQWKAKVLGNLDEPQYVKSLDKLMKDLYEAPLYPQGYKFDPYAYPMSPPSYTNHYAVVPPVGPPIKKVFTKEGPTPHTHTLRVKLVVEGLNLKETVYGVSSQVSTEFLAMNINNPLKVAEHLLDQQLADIKANIMNNLKKESQK